MGYRAFVLPQVSEFGQLRGRARRVRRREGAAGRWVMDRLEPRVLLSAAVNTTLGNLPTVAQAAVFSALRVDESAKLTVTDGAAEDILGNSVALSGNTLVVGAAGAAVAGHAHQGAVYVFTLTGSDWVQTAKLAASDGASGDYFGQAVAISGDTVVIEAPHATVSGHSTQGAAYVFELAGADWTQVAKLTASDGAALDGQGTTVAIQGHVIVIGTPVAAIGGEDQQGAAYVFTQTGSTWSQAAKLTASDGAANSLFGSSVAIDDGTLVVGAFDDKAGTDHWTMGAAYVFTQTGSSWTQTAKLKASDGVDGAGFGVSVAIEGDTIVVGAPWTKVGSKANIGAAYVFTQSASHWTQTAKLSPSKKQAGQGFARSVALSGGTIAVGAWGSTVKGNYWQGATYIYGQSGSHWVQAATVTAADGAPFDQFGSCVALSGNTLVVGSPDAVVGEIMDQGAVYTYEITPLFTKNATHLAFVQQPVKTVAGEHFNVASTTSTVLQVKLLDARGNLVTDGNSSVTISVNQRGGTLTGTRTEPVINGIATFSDLSIKQAGSYTLTARDGAVRAATSKRFTVTPDISTVHLGWVKQASQHTLVGKALSPNLIIAAVDQYNNVVTTERSKILLSTTTGSFSGTSAVTLKGGKATVSNIVFKTAGHYSLIATPAPASTLAGTAPLSFDAIIDKAITDPIPGLTISGGGFIFGKTPSLSITITSDAPSGILFTGTPTLIINGTLSVAATSFTRAGVAKFTLPVLDAGTYSVFVDFGGDANHSASTGVPVGFTVGQATTITTLAASASNLVVGQSLTLTASVKSNQARGIARTGNVEFFDNGTSLGFASLNASSSASLALTVAATGSHSYRAVYVASTDFKGSTSALVKRRAV